MTTTPYTSAIGRFAPSPTGSLHFGSVVAAVASFCMVKKLGGEWLVRIEDLDQPRVVAGATDTILCQLESLGLYWDRSIIFQSQRSERYREILDQLQKDQRLYPCDCSRKEILASAPHIGEEGPIYPGTCLRQPPQHSKPTALRLKTTTETVSFDDLIQGRYEQELAHEVGDFTPR